MKQQFTTGNELLKYMLAAPDSEIQEMMPGTGGEIVVFLGLSEGTIYDYRVHYVLAVAKLRRAWALAMMKESALEVPPEPLSDSWMDFA